MKIIKKNKALTKYSVDKLNKMIDKGIPCWIEHDYYGLQQVDEWRWESKNDPNYNEDEENFNNDGSWCGLVAHVNNHYFPWHSIVNVYLGQKIDVV